MSCEKCSNTMGFAFGTCIECGWNGIEKEWRFIKVHTDDLPESNLKYYLIEKHASKYE